MTGKASPTPLRSIFLVDGFNLYHSLARAVADQPGTCFKWLDLPGLLSDQLQLIDRHARLEAVHYFSAYARHHRQPSETKVDRHKLYVRALTARRVVKHIAKFQAKDVWCPRCQDYHVTYEEKETDVCIACTPPSDCYSPFPTTAKTKNWPSSRPAPSASAGRVTPNTSSPIKSACPAASL